MPADPLKIALYSQEIFDVANPTTQQIDNMVARPLRWQYLLQQLAAEYRYRR